MPHSICVPLSIPCQLPICALNHRSLPREVTKEDTRRTADSASINIFIIIHTMLTCTINRQHAAVQAAQEEIAQLSLQLTQAQEDIEHIRAIATVSENTKQEAIDEEKKQWQEEVVSLQAIMKETVREYELQFHHRLEQERAQWGQYRESVEREITELRRWLSEGQQEENLENYMKKAQEDAEKAAFSCNQNEHIRALHESLV
ncbi:rab GTPase-binding effector 1 isoform X1 [Pelobates cultripes]|uniref:Rab GTPase-binding effector 1 isoform X1 n=1 Tax=Pelobates cultripes TaxID=61616 RepID=A0AAD1W7N7_PELCU|nr:rab GTPase-binding effector 1 isoform X1 [Pelobates cultripes]